MVPKRFFRGGGPAAPMAVWRQAKCSKIYIYKSPFCWFLWLSGKSTPHRPMHVNFTWGLGIFFGYYGAMALPPSVTQRYGTYICHCA